MADKRRIILGLQRIGPRGPEAKSAVNWGFFWWPGPGSNRRPSAFQADAHTN